MEVIMLGMQPQCNMMEIMSFAFADSWDGFKGKVETDITI
jgi:CO dehydrogenase/acetyl-CoA synthase epsilon subunit